MLQCFTSDNHLALLSQFAEWMARSLMFFLENLCIWHILVSSWRFILTALEARMVMNYVCDSFLSMEVIPMKNSCSLTTK